MHFKYTPLYSSVSCNRLSLLMVIIAHNGLFSPDSFGRWWRIQVRTDFTRSAHVSKDYLQRVSQKTSLSERDLMQGLLGEII